MPKPKDARVWNEDLIKALEARYQLALREGKRNALSWRVGRDKIQAVRKDIYQFRTGTIANMPRGLTKTVERLCEDIIRGIKNVFPDGHVPTNGGCNYTNSSAIQKDLRPDSKDDVFISPVSPRISRSSSRANTNNHCDDSNPFHNYNYMKKMKIRGGAFAILMAFHYSRTEVLRKNQICHEAQRFCDDEMEANFHAGRPYGAWASMKTLKQHQFVTEQGYTTFTPNGFRDRPHTYSLTKNGELFNEALFANRPEAMEAAIQAIGALGVPKARVTAGHTRAVNGSRGIQFREVSHSGKDSISAELPFATGKNCTNKNADRVQLEDWIVTANVGDTKEFPVGKDRRKHLHDLCDSLQMRQPGLLLTHGSSGSSRGRTLCIQLVSKPSRALQSVASSIMPPYAGKSSSMSLDPTISSSAFSWPGRPVSFGESPAHLSSPIRSARENAALAAMKREAEARENIELKKAIAESMKTVNTTHNTKRTQNVLFDGKNCRASFHNSNQTIKAEDNVSQNTREPSRQESRKRSTVNMAIFSVESSDDEHTLLLPQKKRKKILLQEKRELTEKEICFIDTDSDGSMIEPPAVRKNNQSWKLATKPRAVMSKKLSAPPSGQSIDLCESSDDDLHATEVCKTKETCVEPIELPRTDKKGPIYLSNGRLMDEEDREVEIVDDSEPLPMGVLTRTKNDDQLTVVIDNRERNRNATPRTLRMELTRHLSSGSLSAVWPPSLPTAQVEEARLDWGDFQYKIQSGNSQPRRLGVSVERKRVNDLVQRSSDGDHLAQLFRMRQHCSLSILLIENDTRVTSSITPYNSQNSDRFDPLDSIITCEDDVFRMFGRIMLSGNGIKFIQSKDEQASLRAVGALGLIALFASENYRKEIDHQLNGKYRKSSFMCHGFKALRDKLIQAGIPWRIAKRIASVVGSDQELKSLYGSCCSEKAKSDLLSHLIVNGTDEDQGDLKSSATGWSNAIYRIVTSPVLPRKRKLSGQAALLLHKELVQDHGIYLSTLYQDHSHEETLELLLDNPVACPKSNCTSRRHVIINLSGEQARKYFNPRLHERAFYKLSIEPDCKARDYSVPIIMRAVNEDYSLSSKALLVFELEGSDMIDLVRDNWSTKKRNDFVGLVKRIAHLVDNICYGSGRFVTTGASGDKRILLLCGLQSALDANAKRSGYATETRILIDLLVAELLLCYNITIIQATCKKMEDRKNIIHQLALACFHFGFLIQENNGINVEGQSDSHHFGPN